jgi:hypothetical protein
VQLDYISGCHSLDSVLWILPVTPLAVYCLQKAFEKIIEVQIGEASEAGAVEETVA